MHKSNFCDFKYSKLLRTKFLKAEYFWETDKLNPNHLSIVKRGNFIDNPDFEYYPAITTDMLLKMFTDQTIIYDDKFKNETVYTVENDWTDGKKFTDRKKLSNALSKMLIWMKEKGIDYE